MSTIKQRNDKIAETIHQKSIIILIVKQNHNWMKKSIQKTCNIEPSFRNSQRLESASHFPKIIPSQILNWDQLGKYMMIPNTKWIPIINLAWSTHDFL